MLTLEIITEKLQDRMPAAIAEATGLSADTVWRVKTGRHTAVSYDTVRRLSDYLTGELTDVVESKQVKRAGCADE